MSDTWLKFKHFHDRTSQWSISILEVLRKLGRKRSDRWFVLGLLSYFCIQCLLIGLTPLPLSSDEAYYWTWAKRLEIAYYDEGPGTAYWIWIFCSLFGDTAFAVRLGAVTCSALLACVVYFFVRQVYGGGFGLLACLLLLSTLNYSSQALFMTIDPPHSLFWMASLGAAALAIKKDDSHWWLPALGAAGLAILCKYTVLILLPAYFFVLLCSAKLRKHLISRGFIWGSLLIALSFLPILIWSYQHNWTNLLHIGNHFTGRQRQLSLRPLGILEWVGGQWGLTGILLFPLLLLALWSGTKQWLKGDKLAALYISASLPLLAICSAVSFFKVSYANWPAPAYFGLLLLLIHLLQEKQLAKDFPWSEQLVLRSLALNIIVLFFAYLLFTGQTFSLPNKLLPTSRLAGWDRLGQTVDQILPRLSNCQSKDSSCPPVYLITQSHHIAASLMFYSHRQKNVYVIRRASARTSQYDLWADWEKLKGQDGLIVLKDLSLVPMLQKVFAKVESVYFFPSLTTYFGENPLNTFYFFHAHDFKGDGPTLEEEPSLN